MDGKEVLTYRPALSLLDAEEVLTTEEASALSDMLTAECLVAAACPGLARKQRPGKHMVASNSPETRDQENAWLPATYRNQQSAIRGAQVASNLQKAETREAQVASNLQKSAISNQGS